MRSSGLDRLGLHLECKCQTGFNLHWYATDDSRFQLPFHYLLAERVLQPCVVTSTRPHFANMPGPVCGDVNCATSCDRTTDVRPIDFRAGQRQSSQRVLVNSHASDPIL